MGDLEVGRKPHLVNVSRYPTKSYHPEWNFAQFGRRVIVAEVVKGDWEEMDTEQYEVRNLQFFARG